MADESGRLSGQFSAFSSALSQDSNISQQSTASGKPYKYICYENVEIVHSRKRLFE